MVASWSVAAKTIISCAITGAIHVPAQTPHLPTTPAQIAAQAIAAAEAGAAILHLHARDPETGRPTADPDVFGRFLPQIKAATDAVINITTGGSVTMSLEERAAAATRFRPELCSMVERTVRILGELSLEPATPDEAREILGLKGAEKTSIGDVA